MLQLVPSVEAAGSQGYAQDALRSHLEQAKAWLIAGHALLAKQQYEASEQCLQAASLLCDCCPVANI